MNLVLGMNLVFFRRVPIDFNGGGGGGGGGISALFLCCFWLSVKKKNVCQNLVY